MQNIFGRFYIRLVAVLVILLTLMGVVSLWLTLRTSDLYFQEVYQNLNRKVAHDIVKMRKVTAAQDGESIVEESSLKALFSNAMAIHPSLEIYLIDPIGNVKAYDAPDELILRRSVELDPIHEFLNRGGLENSAETVPLMYGDDPRHLSRQKTFSAWPVEASDGATLGYMYVILGGQQHDSFADLLERSLILRTGTWVVAGYIGVALVIGFVAFSLLTRPLRHLRGAMNDFRNDRWNSRVAVTSKDEFGALGETYNRMADEIQEQMRNVQERDQLRREMVANISHDLRTPVASLQGYLETVLLKNQTLSAEERQSFLQTALRNTERLSRLVAELFELAKFDAGEIRIQPEEFPLADLVMDALQKFQIRADEKKVKLVLRREGDFDTVRADIGLIERAIDNLLDNAIRYTPPGGTVAVALVGQADCVEVRITDTGSGIPKGELSRVFDRFYRVDKSRNDDSGGTGLGLAITKRILDLHQSPISVRSRLNVGTMFSFTLAA